VKDVVVYGNQTRDLIWQERERILRGVVRMVGELSDRVVESIVEKPAVAETRQATVDVKPLPVKETKPKKKQSNKVNGEAHVLEEMVEKAVDKAISDKFADVLQDISYRIGVLQDLMKAVEGKPSRVTSAQLNLNHHLLDGYTFTANSPSSGYVAWTDCHIVYQGTDYTISNSSTNNKYIYWMQATPSAFQVSNSKPSLGANDCLVCTNEGGTPNVVLVPGKFRSGGSLVDGTVGTGELANSAVTSAKIAASAIFGSHISPSAVTGTHISPSAVGSAQLADNAVTSAKIGAGAVATSKLNTAIHLIY